MQTLAVTGVKGRTVEALRREQEESQGIDGFIGEKPVSIKPATYKIKMGLNEQIQVPVVYYDKKKSDIVIEFDPEELQ